MCCWIVRANIEIMPFEMYAYWMDGHLVYQLDGHLVCQPDGSSGMPTVRNFFMQNLNHIIYITRQHPTTRKDRLTPPRSGITNFYVTVDCLAEGNRLTPFSLHFPYLGLTPP